jgi:hypothetical protein
MNKHGYPGVQKYNNDHGKPYFYRFQIDGRRYQTQGFVTAEEAYRMGIALRKLAGKTRMFPPCTCARETCRA